MPKLSIVMKYMKEIDEMIRDLRNGMKHAHPHSVDALRHYVEELELVKSSILSSELLSGKNLDTLLSKARECLRSCIRPSYANKPEVLPRPIIDVWTPPVTVTGVNIIFVVDITHTMFYGGGLEKGGRMRNLLVDTSKYISDVSKAAGIPCVVSLVFFADPTDYNGNNRPIFWEVALNKESDIGKLTWEFDNVNRTKWSTGADHPESGMSAIHHTIDTVHDASIVNGSPVENSVILVSDERQKLEGGIPGSHSRYTEVTLTEVTNKCDTLGIVNRYGIIPKDYDGITGSALSHPYNNQILPFFTDTFEYSKISKLSHVQDLINWTLDPTSIPTT